MNHAHLPRPPLILGAAGVLPPLLCVTLALIAPTLILPVTIGGALYAALILSFLGGMWWMEALLRHDERGWPYLVAVLPSLIGWALVLPPLLVGGSIQAALILLGLVIIVTPLADARVGTAMRDIAGWARLRWALSLGLGGLTIVLGLIAPR
ncbi:DUF3429 domain-containing protein [Sphingomonas fuzhouensis]|uniref:DUF3429 domain-containing protein n=1 Tax=Sphingomonas fuzhouensis TaxID=3106033 RepID=UPI002AFFB15E|nr:DUF3429 domain-containing protein [Sphingomonas sp. SGZ-02]